MLTICKNDKRKIKELVSKKGLNNIVISNSNLIDDIILAMHRDGIIDCLDRSFLDKRRHNSLVPFKLIIALSIAAKMRIHTSLTDIPVAIKDHRVLAELGYNIVFDNRVELFTEGTIRHLLGKYTNDDLIEYYNNAVQKHILPLKDIKPSGSAYLGQSLPVILKNYKEKTLGYFILYGGCYFCCMSMKEFFEFRDGCSQEIKEYLVDFLAD